MIASSKKIEKYFAALEKNMNRAYSLAQRARAKGFDPEGVVDIPIAKNLADRIIGLVSVEAPQIKNTKIPKRIAELESKYGVNDSRVAFSIALEVAQEKFCKFESTLKAMEVGVRVGLAYQTLGVVSAPLEGFIFLKEKETRDGKKYIAAYYGGPIRAAGGTAEAVSVLLVDFLRSKFGYSRFDPSEKEVLRYKTELRDYHERVSRLQYYPSEEEIVFLIKNIPVELTGQPTSKYEVSNYKDLPRVETNRIRGGMCLVVAEGVAQKSKKILPKIRDWGEDFGLSHWNFLSDYLKLQESILSKKEKTQKDSQKDAGPDEKPDEKIKPNYRYIQETVAGRAVFSYPLAKGGFRLRYGRTRLSGLAGAAMNPTTMFLLNFFIATGTQLKVERPGKACAITPCDTICGPIILLDDGEVVHVDTMEQALKVKNKIKEFLFLGDILFNYGDFKYFNHILFPSPFVPEYWVLLVKRELRGGGFGRLHEKTNIGLSRCEELLEHPLTKFPNAKEAMTISRKLGVPLHPEFIYFYNEIKPQSLLEIYDFLKLGKFKENHFILSQVLEKKRLFELLGVPHKVIDNKLVFDKDHSLILKTFFIDRERFKLKEFVDSGLDILEILTMLSGFVVKDKAPVYVGARMGRPEKAKLRMMVGRPHCLFPCGSEGGRLRSFSAALGVGYIESDLPIFYCENCKSETVFSVCEKCLKKTKQMRCCPNCQIVMEEEVHCGEKTRTHKKTRIGVKHHIDMICKNFDLKMPKLVKGVRGMTNKDKIPEHLAKGFFRSMNNVYVNKDGTTRLDMIETPMTHFKPNEIGTSIEKLKELGYEFDIFGKMITDPNQVIELLPQDIVLPACSSWPEANFLLVLNNICNYIDALLEKFYKLPTFYNVKSRKDLVGLLGIALAPHTSAGVLCRIIGFSDTQAFYAHPYLHAACRRNCLPGDETVLVQNSTNWKLPTFSELDEGGAFGLRTQTINEEGAKQVNKIKNLVKNRAPENLILFKIEAGREIKVTPEHKMIVLEGGKLIKKKATQVKIGDRMIALSNLEVKNPINNINVLNWYLKSEKKEKIRVHNLKKEVKEHVKKKGGLSKFLKSLSWRKHWGKKRQYNSINIAINKDSLPLTLFEELNVDKAGSVEISYNKQKSRIKPVIPLNYEFGFLVGLLLSDGCVRTTKKKEDQQKFVYQTVWATQDDEILRKVVNFCTKLFRKPTITKRRDGLFDIVLSGRVYYDFFRSILGIKRGALNRRLPYQILNSDLECVKGCLAGFITGDGSIDKIHKEIIITSNNKHLLNDLGTLSLRIGVFPYYKKERRVLKTGVVADYYKKKNINYKYVSFKLRFNSFDSSKILEFLVGEKKEKLKNCLRNFKPRGNRLKKFRDFYALSVRDKQQITHNSEYVYDIEIDSEDKTYFAGFGNLAVWDCDGDELGFIVLLDALLNFSRQYLPDKRGSRSVSYDTLVYCMENGESRIKKIGELVDKAVSLSHYKDGECEISKASDLKVFSFDPGSKKVFPCNVSKLIRHKAPPNMLRVKTTNGEIVTTPDHSLFTSNGKFIHPVRAGELKKGDTVITPLKVSLPNQELPVVDIGLLIPNKLYCRGISSKLKNSHNSLLNEEKTNILKKWGPNNVYRYLNGTRAPPYLFCSELGVIPEKVGLSKSVVVNKNFSLNEDFFKILAYLIAEGHYSSGEIVNTDKKIIAELTRIINDLLGVELNVRVDKRNGCKDCYRVILPSIFMMVLKELGLSFGKARSKELPWFLFHASLSCKRVFLNAYVETDGHYYKSKNLSKIYTSSEKIAAGISIITHSLGLKSSCRRTKDMFEVLFSEINNSDPFWPLWDYTKEMCGSLRSSGFNKAQVSSLLANYRKNTRMKTASYQGIKKLCSCINDGDLKQELTSLLNSDLKVERVLSVERIRYDYDFVYDFEVPGYQNFLCGPHPIFAHNSMDAPLVLSIQLNPLEVDNEAFNMDVCWHYPLSFYEAAEKFKNPKDVKVGTVKERLDKPEQFEGFGFTHTISNINLGPMVSNYKILETMQEKVEKQMELAEKIRAVHVDDVAKLVIEKHFLRDIKGNLRKFSKQEFRCVFCNTKYRRIPLMGNCSNCKKGRIIFTVSEGTVSKYLEPSMKLAEKYNLPVYLKQTLEILKRRIESVFGKELEKQADLKEFFS